MAGIFDVFEQIDRMQGPGANLLGAAVDPAQQMQQPAQQGSFLDTIQQNLMQTFGPRAMTQANQSLTGLDAMLGLGEQLGRQFAGMQAANLTPPTMHGVIGPRFDTRAAQLPMFAGIGG